MARNPARRCARCDVPHKDGAVAAAGREARVVVRNCQREHLVAMRLECLDLRAGSRIPQAHGTILAAAHHIRRGAFTVAHDVHSARMTFRETYEVSVEVAWELWTPLWRRADRLKRTRAAEKECKRDRVTPPGTAS